MEAECGDELKALSGPLDAKMGFVMSHWEDSANITDIEQTCGSSNRGCRANTSSSFSGFSVKQDGSVESGDDGNNDGDGDGDGDGDKGEIIYGNVATSLSECQNSECTECVEAWYENDDTTFHMCMNESRFKYSNKCGKKKD